MRTLTPGSRLDDLTGSYGPTWRRGVLSEHLHLVDEATKVFVSASGARTYVSDGHSTYPVVCSELVDVHTEDGFIVGRCGGDVPGDSFTCDGHRRYERVLDELELLDWERNLERAR
jgi:hypothetical protein